MKRKTKKNLKRHFCAVVAIFFLLFTGNEIIAEDIITPKIFIQPDLETYEQTELLTINVFGQAELKSINLSKVVLEFDSDKLSLTKINYSDSFCKLLIYEKNEESRSDFACGTFTANLDEVFHIAEITFEKKILTSDWADFNLNDSIFFAHDGYGTNIIPKSETHKIILLK